MAKAYDYLFKLLLIGKTRICFVFHRDISIVYLGDSGVGKVNLHFLFRTKILLRLFLPDMCASAFL